MKKHIKVTTIFKKDNGKLDKVTQTIIATDKKGLYKIWGRKEFVGWTG